MPEKSLAELVGSARITLHIHTDGAYAEFLGVSRRTVQRHKKSTDIPGYGGAAKLVRALFAADPATARTLARTFRVDLPEPPSPAVRVPTVGPGHVAMFVLGVAEALERRVPEVRALLSTIFGAALALGLDLNELGPLLVRKNEGKDAGAKPSTSA